MQKLYRELYVETCINRNYNVDALIGKVAQTLALRSKMMQPFTKLIQKHQSEQFVNH